jgi:hypothetical protein
MLKEWTAEMTGEKMDFWEISLIIPGLSGKVTVDLKS